MNGDGPERRETWGNWKGEVLRRKRGVFLYDLESALNEAREGVPVGPLGENTRGIYAGSFLTPSIVSPLVRDGAWPSQEDVG